MGLYRSIHNWPTDFYRWPICKVGKVRVGLLTRTNLLPLMATPTVVPPEDPVLNVPSGCNENVSEPATPVVWPEVDVASKVLVKVPLLARVMTPNSACADWLTTSEV